MKNLNRRTRLLILVVALLVYAAASHLGPRPSYADAGPMYPSHEVHHFATNPYAPFVLMLLGALAFLA